MTDFEIVLAGTLKILATWAPALIPGILLLAACPRTEVPPRPPRIRREEGSPCRGRRPWRPV